MHRVQERHAGCVGDQSRVAMAHVGKEEIRSRRHRWTPPRIADSALISLVDPELFSEGEIAGQTRRGLSLVRLQQPNRLVCISQCCPVLACKRKSAKMSCSGRADADKLIVLECVFAAR